MTFYGICQVDTGMGQQLGLVFEWCDKTLAHVMSELTPARSWEILRQARLDIVLCLSAPSASDSKMTRAQHVSM